MLIGIHDIMWRHDMTGDTTGYLRKILWFPIAYILVFAVLLLIVWSKLDTPAVIAVVSVLGGGLAGVVGSFLAALIALERVERESEVKLKEYASSQAIELTKLEIELRLKEGRQNELLAAAKIYREFYRALFDLYETKKWPKEIEEQGLLNIYDFGARSQDRREEDKTTT
jgi:hypothetical protein